MSATWRSSSPSSSLLPFLPQCGLSAVWTRSSSPLSASLKPDLPGIGRLSGSPLLLPPSPCGHTRYSQTHCLWYGKDWSDDILICVRYETFSNVVLDTQTICGMRRTVWTDRQTYRQNSKLNTLVWGSLTLVQL